MRLYPINFRFIEQNLAFKKYDMVTLEALPATDRRRESRQPRIDTLRRETNLDGGGNGCGTSGLSYTTPCAT